MRESKTVLEVKDLSFSYNHHPVFDGINFKLKRGDYLWVLGPNGSGKTTLVKAVLGIIRPQRGTVLLFGKELYDFDDWGRISYIPQSIDFFDPYLPASAKEVAAMGLLAGRKNPKRLSAEDREIVLEAFRRLGIFNIRNKRIGELSGGQRKRVLIARAMIKRPDLLFMDEPTAAVEPKVREDFYKIADEINDKGTTVILINHDIAGMGINNNKILYINQKQIFFGEGREFCMSEEMGDYFGSSQHIICHQHLEDGK